ncbi:hypothetical protein FB45DRAFT_946649 [Roridomyces roridus]|uniref:Uncharacterized protein n=1 Tax=Roridomyces roridus TaxID=1738132 RepID=A0AAD7B326_9AGAR|nr:hypothetical protein FB45DRAFT_946649 [Roridomyces roridus]
MLSISVAGGIGGAGGVSPKIGGERCDAGGAQVDSEAAKLTQNLALVGGTAGAGGQGGDQGGDGGYGNTAALLLPLLTAEDIHLLPPRLALKEFCDNCGLEDVYLKLNAQGYRRVAAVAVASPQKLMDACKLREGDIDELKVEMQALIGSRNVPIVQASVTIDLP